MRFPKKLSRTGEGSTFPYRRFVAAARCGIGSPSKNKLCRPPPPTASSHCVRFSLSRILFLVPCWGGLFVRWGQRRWRAGLGWLIDGLVARAPCEKVRCVCSPTHQTAAIPLRRLGRPRPTRGTHALPGGRKQRFALGGRRSLRRRLLKEWRAV